MGGAEQDQSLLAERDLAVSSSCCEVSRKLPLVLRNKLRSKEGKRLGPGCAAEPRLGPGFGRDPALLAWVVFLGFRPRPAGPQPIWG